MLHLCWLLHLISCAGLPLHERANSLPEDRAEEVVRILTARSDMFRDGRGRFTVKIEKPGTDLSFQGVFLLQSTGPDRFEIFSPFGTVAHLLVLEEKVFRSISEEGILEGSIFDFVPEIQDRWGIDIAPYQLLSLVSGSYIPLNIYTIDTAAMVQVGVGGNIRVPLHCSGSGATELLTLSGEDYSVVRRELHPVKANTPLTVRYDYDDSDQQLNVTPQFSRYLPRRTIIEQKGVHARLTIDLTSTRVSLTMGKQE